ncbi:multifunctional acyl-CoA thioesterase I and protease I and lysophospholipase L1 [compost metagenome]
MRFFPIWLGASVLGLALGCQPAAVQPEPAPVTVAGNSPEVERAAIAAASTAPVPTPRTPPPTEAPVGWLAFGDSLTQDAFATILAWREVLGPNGPTPINAGVRGDTTTTALARIDGVLTAHPSARFVGLAFGTNDVWGRMTVAQFRTNMQALIDRVKAAGRTPVLATIPYSPESELASLPTYNQVLRELEAANGLPSGPDLYALTQADEALIMADGVHMTPVGSQAIQRAWAETAARMLR